MDGFHFEQKRISDDSTLCRITQNGQILSFMTFLKLLLKNEDFRTFFSNQLVMLFGPSSKAFLWECVPVCKDSVQQVPFMFVIEQSTPLASMSCDRQSFQNHFKNAASENLAITFNNLGGDAHLVVPTPVAGKCYTHLALFLTQASETQKSQFWRVVAETMLERLTDQTQPLWLSTNGLGVGWLHVRIDQKPKYYRFAEFRKWPVDQTKLWNI